MAVWSYPVADEELTWLSPLVRQPASGARKESGPHSSHHAWEAILEKFQYPVARFDRKLRHVYVNKATERATSIKVREFIGKGMRELGHAEEVSEQIERNLRAVFNSGKQRSFNLVFDGPNGRITYQCRMTPEFDPRSKVEHVLVISRDIPVRRGTRV
ncbi:MAG TPA: PAS domain-containing protein [Candidatus Angelobacter sp.]|nr:PAS domain-containing protein [Candidatus Angelobacter sp.]